MHLSKTNGCSTNMSLGVPGSLRHSARSSFKTLLQTVLVLGAATLLVSLIASTHRVQQHVRIGAQHFHQDTFDAANGTSARQQQLAQQQLTPTQPPTQRYNASAQIPRLIHVNYMSGPQQLLSDALRPLSHFRKEWWLSCKTHHPSWQHMFWDAAACEQLVREHYPWFLPTWRTLVQGGSIVLQSDAIRPFILHAHGGVYLDLDSECFTDMTPWLAGAQLVMQAEVGHTINNAQIANVPHHPLWARFQRAMQARLAAGKRWPLEATGPHLLTDIVREVTGNSKQDLPGAYSLADGSRLAVYGPGQWFTPCAWNDWTCAVRVARERPLLWAAGRAAVATAQAQVQAAAAASDQLQPSSSSAAASNTSVAQAVSAASSPAVSTAPGAVKHSAAEAVLSGFPVMLGVPGVCGVHHFSGSWLGLDGSKSLSLRREGVSGVLSFLYEGTGFVKQPCRQLKLLQSGQRDLGSAQPSGNSQQPRGAAAALPVCWDSIAAAAAAGSCSVLSVRSRPCCTSTASGVGGSGQAAQQQPQLQDWLWGELALAKAGCSVKLVTEAALTSAQLEAELVAQPSAHTAAQQGGSSASTGGSNAGSNSSSSSSSSSIKDLKAMLARISLVNAVLGVSPDPFAEPAVHTLDSLLAAAQGHARLTLLVLDLPATPCVQPADGPAPSTGTAAKAESSAACRAHSSSSVGVLDLLNQLYTSGSPILQRVDSLVLTLQPAGKAGAHKAFAAYQHLFQESGFVGYYHAAARSAASGVGGGGAAVAQPVVLGLVRSDGSWP